MDNQTTDSGSARDTGREGAGSSMGKDAAGNRGPGGIGSSGSMGATSGAGSTSGSSVIDKARDVASELPSTAAGAHTSIDKAAEAAKPAVDRLASSAHAGVDKMSGALSGASQAMEEKSRQLTEAASRLAVTGREYVRTSPATAIMVAVGVGVVLSKLLGRRR